jgi:hypothetical protein
MAEWWEAWDEPEHIVAGLETLPLAELRWRAAVVTALSGGEGSHSSWTRSYPFGCATRYACNNSGGQAVQWYFTKDGRALLIAFEQEGDLNLPDPSGDFDLLRTYYRGVPDDLLPLAGDRTCAYENRPVSDRETGATLLLATGVCWYDGERWHLAEGLLEFCEKQGINPAHESGFRLEPYLLGKEFTPESYFGAYLARGYPMSAANQAAALIRIRETFGRHPRERPC